MDNWRTEVLSRTTSKEPRLFAGFFCFLGAILIFRLIFWLYPQLPPLLNKFVTGLAGFAVVLLFRRGKRLWQPSIRQRLERDPRAPIVYLRAFEVDSLLKDREAQIFLKAIMSNYGTTRHEEERLAPICSRAGPFVALGNPYESLPPLGGTRLYCTDEEWRQTVALLLNNAVAAVFALEFFQLSDPTKWEFELATQVLSPGRIFIVVTKVGKYSTRANWQPSIWGNDPRILDSTAIQRFFEVLSIKPDEVLPILGGVVLQSIDKKTFRVVRARPLARREFSADPLADALGRALNSSGLIGAPPWYRILWHPVAVVVLSILMLLVVGYLLWWIV